MARLSVSLLGPMRTLLNDIALDGFGYDKVRALLAYLVVEGRRPLARTELAELLWPDLAPGGARTNLRHALATLRHTIGDERANPSFLLIDRNSVQLNPTADILVDVTVFSDLLAVYAACPHPPVDLCAACVGRLTEAIALYQGDFLALFSLPDSIAFDEWSLILRERFHEQAVDALSRLTAYHEHHGNATAAREAARRWTELARWDEEAHRSLMRLYDRTGQRGAALMQFERCRRILFTELGIAPAAETVELYNAIRSGAARAPRAVIQSDTTATWKPEPRARQVNAPAGHPPLAEDAAAFSFGGYVHQRRRILGLTRDTLADQVGIATITLRKIEADERRPSRQVAELLADRLHLESTERQLFIQAARAEKTPARLKPLDDRLDGFVQPLPPALDTLIGRETDLARLADLLHEPATRLVTLSGPPGVGKTRLALAAAHALITDARFSDGVFFVALAPLRDPSLVATAILRALGVPQIANQPANVILTNYFQHKRTLLALDNFEHVMAATPLISRLLADAPQLVMLITSRLLLRVTYEREYPVAPLKSLETPDTIMPTRLAPAVQLFVERARVTAPQFALDDAMLQAVTALCLRLDGLPLAIELAAARVRLLSPQHLLERLKIAGSLDTLGHGPLDIADRQQTLRRAIAWSYDLLQPIIQQTFRRLGVFVGGWSLTAAEHICATPAAESILDQLGALIDHSLIQIIEMRQGEPRFTMLETLREFALEQLHTDPEEYQATRRRHAEYFGRMAQAIEEQFFSAADTLALRQIEAEASNIRAAMEWALDGNPSLEQARLALWPARGLFWLWLHHGPIAEGRRFLQHVLAATEGCPPSSERVYVWLSAGWLSDYSADNAAARQAASAALTQARQLGVPKLIFGALWLLSDSCLGHDIARATALADEALEVARQLDACRFGIALFHRAAVAMYEGDMARSVTLFEQSLNQIRGARATFWLGEALMLLGIVHRFQGDITRGRALSEECLALWRQLGARRETLTVLRNLVMLARDAGDYGSAARYAGELLAQSRDLGEPGVIAGDAGYVALIAFEQGDEAQARQFAEEALNLSRSANDDADLACALWMAGMLALKAGNIAAAATISAECMVHAQRTSEDWPPVLAYSLAGQTATAQGNHALALNLLRARLELREARINRWERAEGLTDLGLALLEGGNVAEAVSCLEQALEIYRIYGSDQRITTIANALERCRSQ